MADRPPALAGLKILSKLGQGGMGAVYKAQHLSLGRLVAVKVLAGPLAGNPAYVERFLREARYLARLRHPNLVTIYDVSSAGPVPHLVMEYVEGSTLSKRLSERGGMAWAEARQVLERILDAVSAIHATGLVHRDLKPANIMLDAAGQVKVMDFGLAKDASEAALTQEGMILGTPEYMSPEQAKGDPVSPASDVYALGVIAYETVSGRPPFKADSTIATLRMQCQDDPPSFSSPGLPDSAGAWIRKAMAKDPAARYRDAAEMRRALDAPAPAPATPDAVPHPPPRRRWRLPAAAAGILLALLALLAWRPAKTPAAPRARLAAAEQEAVEGSLVSIRPGNAGGHVVTLKTGGEERAVEIPADRGAELTLAPAP